MNYIWAGMMVISLVVSIASGSTKALSDSVMEGAAQSVELIVGILGMLCFWSGMMEIAKRSGITGFLARVFSPVLRLLFRDVEGDSEAMKYISLNISANLLGLGNAATPLGIAAMKELQGDNPLRDRATDDMVVFVVMNTASIQLLPTTVGVYRARFGSAAPFDILPCVWIASAAALAVGVTLAKVLCNAGSKGRK